MTTVLGLPDDQTFYRGSGSYELWAGQLDPILMCIAAAVHSRYPFASIAEARGASGRSRQGRRGMFLVTACGAPTPCGPCWHAARCPSRTGLPSREGGACTAAPTLQTGSRFYSRVWGLGLGFRA